MKRILNAVIIIVLSTNMLVAENSKSILINKIDVEFIGKVKTNAKALRGSIDISEGQTFDNVDVLDKSLKDVKAGLKNTRYFKSVEVKKTEVDGGYNISITVEDGWTFVPIPYPLPDSGVGINGWSFGMEVNYDNMFGSMRDFYFDGYVNMAFGEENMLKEWKLRPKLKKIKIGNLAYDFEFIQNYKTTEVTDPTKVEGEQLLQHYTNNETFFKVETSLKLSDLISYKISPQIGVKYLYDYHDSFESDYTMENGLVIEDRLNFVIDHSLSTGQVNWEGPLREGYDISLANSLKFLSSYDNSVQKEDFRFVTNINPSIKYYKPIGNRLNYYTKLQGLVIFNNRDTGLGSNLRAVKNSSMSGDLGVFWQNTLAIEIVGSDTVHFQIHPFIDSGIALDRSESKSFEDMFRYGFGADIIIMLGSIDIKGKIGYDPVSDYIDFSFSTGLSY